MNRVSNAFGIVVVVLTLAALAQPASAALSPAKIAQLKNDATEVFVIEVVEVTVADPKAAQSKTVIKAKVTQVERSSDQVMQGEQIVIDSYRVSVDGDLDVKDEAAVKETLDALVSLVGPKVPPNIEPAWTGKVYLKLSDAKGEVNRYGLAAFGHSFVPMQDDTKE